MPHTGEFKIWLLFLKIFEKIYSYLILYIDRLILYIDRISLSMFLH